MDSKVFYNVILSILCLITAIVWFFHRPYVWYCSLGYLLLAIGYIARCIYLILKERKEIGNEKNN